MNWRRDGLLIGAAAVGIASLVGLTVLADVRTRAFFDRQGALPERWILYGALAIALTLVSASTVLGRREMTHRRTAEREERSERARLDAVLQSLGEGVLVVDRHGCVVLHNAAAERMLGAITTGWSPAERAERLSFSLPDRVTPYPIDQLPLSRAIRGESCEGVQVFARQLTTGRGIMVSVTATPLRAAGDVVDGGVVVFRDTTEQTIAQEELRRSNAELEQFAYVASHDLQEPLRMVASYTQLLAKRYKGRLDADADEFIGYAVDGATRMQQLIRDLLAYSRAGTRKKDLEPISSEVALDRAVANLRAAIDESQAVITHDPLPEVLGDDTQLPQVFQNLLGNAIKYRGAEPPRIHVSAKPDEQGDYLFAVRDNGIGMDPRYRDRIFLLFQRLHGRDDYPGTGIGLTITKKIVERHGGRIWVESEPGRGSCFYFTLTPRRTEWPQPA